MSTKPTVTHSSSGEGNYSISYNGAKIGSASKAEITVGEKGKEKKAQGFVFTPQGPFAKIGSISEPTMKGLKEKIAFKTANDSDFAAAVEAAKPAPLPTNDGTAKVEQAEAAAPAADSPAAGGVAPADGGDIDL